MPAIFAITTATNTIRLDDMRQGEASFAVFNASGRALRARARLVAENPAAQGWLALAGETERDFDIAHAEQYSVHIKVPPAVPAGSYPFRLDMVGVEDTHRDYAEGPTVTFTVPEPQPQKRPFPWWILAVVAILIAGAAIIAFILWPRNVTVPDVEGETVEAAIAILEAAGLAVNDATVTEQNDTIPAGTVILTDPEAGTEVRRGSEVTLVVSAGEVVIRRFFTLGTGTLVPDLARAWEVSDTGQDLTLQLTEETVRLANGELFTAASAKQILDANLNSAAWQDIIVATTVIDDRTLRLRLGSRAYEKISVFPLGTFDLFNFRLTQLEFETLQ